MWDSAPRPPPASGSPGRTDRSARGSTSRGTRSSSSRAARRRRRRCRRVGRDGGMTTTTGRARLADVTLPDFGTAAIEPLIPPGIYAPRLERLRERAATQGFDALVVYADREHSANLAWLTGFDPRFEEAIAVVRRDGDPLILAGNECYGTAGAAPLRMRRELYQDLSLPGQPRDRSRELGTILGDEGIGPGSRVGVLGWKTFADASRIEIPAYIVDELRHLTGSGGLVENANDLLIEPGRGLRAVAEVEQ